MRGVRRLVAIFLVVSVVAGSFLAWDRWWRRAGPVSPGLNCPAVVSARHRVPFAAFGVHRVALIGDSIMLQASCAIAYSLRDLGIETSRYAVPGSGLLTGVDWIAKTRRILRAQHPDVVVAIFVGNYYPPPLRDSSGAVIEPDSAAFFRAWQFRARLLSAEVHAAHARMYWVSPPPITLPRVDRSGLVFAGYRSIPGDHVLLSGHVLAGPNNSEVAAKTTCGRRRLIRASDTLHLTDDGGRIYGQQIAHDLTADLGLLTAPKPC